MIIVIYVLIVGNNILELQSCLMKMGVVVNLLIFST